MLYRHWSGALHYTEGVRYLAQQGNANWLIDEIATSQYLPTLVNDPRLQRFQLWELKVDSSRITLLVCEQSSKEIVLARLLEQTKFPLDSIQLYLKNKVLMLPSESKD